MFIRRGKVEITVARQQGERMDARKIKLLTDWKLKVQTYVPQVP